MELRRVLTTACLAGWAAIAGGSAHGQDVDAAVLEAWYAIEGVHQGAIAENDRVYRTILLEDGSLFLYDNGIILEGGLSIWDLVPGTSIVIAWVKDTADHLILWIAPAA
jgi:hypothetical protein